MSTQRILIITDCHDIAANELHATLATCLERLGADHVVIEPIVAVTEFSVIQADFAARLLVESYDPASLTILTVANPLDTSSARRARIAIRLRNGTKLVGANTGVFSSLIRDFGIAELCETNSQGLKGDGFISFGGKFIHAPIAAKLAATDDLTSVKESDFTETELAMLPLVPGSVVHIDNFGVAKISSTANDITAVPGDVLELSVGDRSIGTATFCHSMKELPDGTLAIYKGSSLGYLEIGIVRRLGAAQHLGLSIGDVVTVSAGSQQTTTARPRSHGRRRHERCS